MREAHVNKVDYDKTLGTLGIINSSLFPFPQYLRKMTRGKNKETFVEEVEFLKS